MTTETRKLHRKLAQIMYEAERIPKNGRAPKEMGGYPFVQVGDAADYIRKALAENVITMMPTGVQLVGQADRPTKAGGTMTTVDLITTWTLTDGETGETITIQSFGAGADGGDKYSGKASTSAMKYALLTGFLLSTGEDSELGMHEAGKALPKLHTDEERMAIAAASAKRPANTEGAADASLIGVVEVGKPEVKTDFLLRPDPDRGYHLSFRLISKQGGIRVDAFGYLAEELQTYRDQIVGKRVSCWGTIEDQEFTPKGTRKAVTYQVLALERIRVPDLGDLPSPEPDDPAEASSIPLFSQEEEADIAAAVDAAAVDAAPVAAA